MDNYDHCIIGVCERFGQEPIIAYDKTKVIQKLQSEGMTEEEAIEYFEYNQIGAWMGETTPCFVILSSLEEIEEAEEEFCYPETPNMTEEEWKAGV